MLEGEVRNYVPGKTFAAMVESLNKAILIIEMCSMPGHGHFLYLSLVTWGLPKAEVDALKAGSRRSSTASSRSRRGAHGGLRRDVVRSPSIAATRGRGPHCRR